MTDRPASMHAAPIVAVSDLDRARAFYEGRLGLEGHASAGGGWVLAADHGTVVNLLPGVDGAGSATWPVATFLVDDATAVVRDLHTRGVPFLGPADIPFTLDADGVSTDDSGMRVAWMRDPDGNILTVYSVA
jgi:catechol 2,3-dioxygenase-like lactoylglutathione lyase family enzyme